MDANKLVEYVYRRTKKTAKIVPQPEPEKPAEDPPKPEEAAEKPPEEPKPEEAKEEQKEGGDEGKPPAEGGGGGSGEGGGENKQGEPNKGEGEGVVEEVIQPINYIEEESMKRMMYSNYYNYQQPLYVIERIPPPQLFSDENPNACCIS